MPVPYHRRLAATLLSAVLSVSLPAVAHAQAPAQPVFADDLAPGWSNFSWASVDVRATAPVYRGARSIAVTYAAWQALYLEHPSFNTAGLTHLRLYVHGGGTGGQRMALYVAYAEGGTRVDGPKVQVLRPLAHQWLEVKIPLSDLGAADRVITGLHLIDTSGQSQPTLYVDEIAFVREVDGDSPSSQQVSVLPRASLADGATSLAVRAQLADPQGLADIARVTLDARPLGRGMVALADDGRSSDGRAGDGSYGASLTVAPGTPAGEYALAVHAEDRAGNRSTSTTGALVVLTAPGGRIPPALPQRLGWGTNQWSLTPNEDWQVNSGVPWDYVNQYITYDWYADGWGGGFVTKFVEHAWRHRFTPIVSVYMILSTPPLCGESAACYAQKLQDPAAVQRYFDALAEAARQARGERPVIFQLEPDFYGFMQDFSNSDGRPAGVRPDDPASYPAAVNTAGYPNTLAGFGRRMVDVIHQNAPNALVAPHVSMWGSRNEPNGVPAGEVAGLARRSAAFVGAMGGAQADLLSVEWSDKDAGSGATPWWDDANIQLPRPSRAVLWENALSAAAGKRLLLWQVPSGNMELDNSCSHYRDNRAAYAFRHAIDLARAGVLGIVFGGGRDCTTSPATDGGFIAAQAAIAYAPPAAPAGLHADAPVGAGARVRWDDGPETDLSGYRLRVARQGGGATYVREAGRASAATLLLPAAGTWAISLVAYDAMGNQSPPSAPVYVTTTTAPEQIFLPLLR